MVSAGLRVGGAAHAQADRAPVCIRLLSLDGALLQPPAADRAALQRELVASAQGLARAPALPGPLTDLRLPGGHVDALRMLWVQVSLFYRCILIMQRPQHRHILGVHGSRLKHALPGVPWARL